MKSRLVHWPVVVALLLSLLGSALNVTPAGAASFSVSDVTELINAINTANSNGAADTITLTENITLTAVDNVTFGENGLPVIQADGGNALTIDGNGFTLSRSSAGGTPRFRFFEVVTGATLTVQNITLSNGFTLSYGGGAIYNRYGTLNITNSVFDGNSGECDPSCDVRGGAVYSFGTLTITNSAFLNNTVDSSGGAVHVTSLYGSTATITNSTFSQNSSASDGGAIYNGSNLTITNSTITNNSAGINGGGIENLSAAIPLIIANSTIAENSATYNGGGIHVEDGEVVSINNTFSDNGSANGGNIYSSGVIELKNTIISMAIFFLGNCAGGGTITAGADNLATGTPCDSATQVTSTMLKLSPTLADNGGPTQTLALLSGSVAIDAGNAATCASAPISGKDQRGVTRPFGAGCDVGAFEFDGNIPTVTITPASYTVNEQTVLNLHGTGISVNDLDGDPLTVTITVADVNAKLTASVGTTGAVIASGNGTNTQQLSGTIAQLNDFFAGNSGGTLTFLLDDDTPVSSLILTIIAIDGVHSGNDTAAINITAVNDPPIVANPIPDQSAVENVAFNYQFPSNTFNDLDGDVLTYTAQLLGGGALPAWLSFDVVTRTFSGTPSVTDAGVYSIDVTADDGNGGLVTDTFTLTANTVAPLITSVNSSNPDGTYIIGDEIFVIVKFDHVVSVDTLGGLPTILLETGATDRTAEYLSGSGTDTLTFRYIVQAGDATPDLDYLTTTVLALNGGTILSVSATPSILTLPVPGGAASIAGQHGIVIDGIAFGVVSASLLPTYTTGPATFTVTFDDDASDPAGDTNPDDVTNPANYLLVEDGANGIFDTTSCLGGFTSDDTQVTVASVSYLSKTAVVILLSPPTNGTYRLFVCGTTSIVDLAGNPIAGNGLTSGTDYILDFVVAAATTGTPTETENTRASLLPSTGFAPNKMTSLPSQPATLAYAELGDIWLEIPSLNVKTSIVGVPQDNAEWDVTWLGNNTGWLNGTAFPTWNGNSILTAHVTNASGLEGPFAALKLLEYGDQIIVHMGGVKYIYEIQASRMVRPYSISFAFESLQDHSYLTLITCQEYIPQNETYRFRRVVRAVLVSVVNQ